MQNEVKSNIKSMFLTLPKKNLMMLAVALVIPANVYASGPDCRDPGQRKLKPITKVTVDDATDSITIEWELQNKSRNNTSLPFTDFAVTEYRVVVKDGINPTFREHHDVKSNGNSTQSFTFNPVHLRGYFHLNAYTESKTIKGHNVEINPRKIIIDKFHQHSTVKLPAEEGDYFVDNQGNKQSFPVDRNWRVGSVSHVVLKKPHRCDFGSLSPNNISYDLGLRDVDYDHENDSRLSFCGIFSYSARPPCFIGPR